MYLFSEPAWDGAGTYASFIMDLHLRLLYPECEYSVPEYIQLRSRGEHHLAYAENRCLQLGATVGKPIPADYGGSGGLVDWLIETNSVSRGIPFIVACTQFCLADISTVDEHFRQAFYCGEAVSPCVRTQRADVSASKPYVQVRFTIGAPVFGSSLIAVEQMRRFWATFHRYGWLQPEAELLRIATRRCENGFDAKVRPKTVQPQTRK
jgi:hypothetical protein